MDAVVQGPFGDVHRGNTGLLLQIFQRQNEFVHADLIVSHMIGTFELVHHVVGVEHSLAGSLFDAFLA